MTFIVCIRPGKDYYCRSLERRVLPEKILEKLFLNNEDADVSFKVKKNVFYAHKSVLKVAAPEFHELAEQFDKKTRMPIQEVEPEIFKLMLKYMYGQNISPHEWKENSKPILEASGKYGFTDLRLAAEAWYLKNLKLTKDNAVDELLYADGTNCLVLKKAVLDFIVDNGESVLGSSSFSMLYESQELTKEVMMELAKSSRKRVWD